MFASKIFRWATALCAATWLAGSALAQSGGTLKIVIGFPAGGALDNMSRAIAEKLREDFDQTVIVDNKPGASTQIALMAVKRAPADGNTILISPASPFILQPLTYDKLPFDPDLDLVPLAHLADTPLIATTAADSPYSNMSEYVDWVKNLNP